MADADYAEKLELLDEPDHLDTGWRLVARPYRPGGRLPSCEKCPASLICEAGGRNVIVPCEAVTNVDYEMTRPEMMEEDDMPRIRTFTPEQEKEIYQQYLEMDGARGAISSIWKAYKEQHPELDVKYHHVRDAIERQKSKTQVVALESEPEPVPGPEPEPEAMPATVPARLNGDVGQEQLRTVPTGLQGIPSLSEDLEQLLADIRSIEERVARLNGKVGVVRELLEAVL